MNKLYGVAEIKENNLIFTIADEELSIIAQREYSLNQRESLYEEFLGFLKADQNHFSELTAVGITYSPYTYTFGEATNLQNRLQQELNLPVAIETDANLSILAEWKWGQGKGVNNLLYLDIGNYITGAVISENRLVASGNLEIGHIKLPHNEILNSSEHACPFHDDCFMSLASKKAAMHRWGNNPANFSLDDISWQLETGYLASAISSLIYIYAPEKIILSADFLFDAAYDLIRQKVKQNLNGYVQVPQARDDLIGYIVPPQFTAPALRGIINVAQILENEPPHNRLAGDSTTGAPPPNTKKKRKGK